MSIICVERRHQERVHVFSMVILRRLPIVSIRSNSVEVRGRRPWSYTMSKQPNVELTIVTAEHSLGKSTAVKRKPGRPKKQTDFGRSEELPDMHAEHGFGKSSESTTVKRKPGRPKKRTEASFDRSEELHDMSVGHSCGKSSAAKRGRHTKPMLMAMTDTKVVTLEELQKGDRGWFVIKPTVTIVALCWDRYSYHCCVKCRLRALPNAGGKYGCVQHPAAMTKEIYCLRILLGQDDLNMWVTAFADVADLIMGVSVEEFHAFDNAGRKRIAWGAWNER